MTSNKILNEVLSSVPDELNYSDYFTVMDVGGPVLFLLDNCIQNVCQLKSSMQAFKVTEAMMDSSESICEMAWEALHTGNWKDVSISWRYLYSYGSLIKAVFLLCSGEKEKEALRACDLGLLMGAPIFDNILSRIATILNSVIPVTLESHLETKSKMSKSEHHKTPVIHEASRIPHISSPSIEYFQNNHLNKEKPLVIENGMHFWPALLERQWNIDYLLKVAGSRTVPVEIGKKYTEENWSQKLMVLSSFVEKYILDPKYMNTVHISEKVYGEFLGFQDPR